MAPSPVIDVLAKFSKTVDIPGLSYNLGLDQSVILSVLEGAIHHLLPHNPSIREILPEFQKPIEPFGLDAPFQTRAIRVLEREQWPASIPAHSLALQTDMVALFQESPTCDDDHNLLVSMEDYTHLRYGVDSLHHKIVEVYSNLVGKMPADERRPYEMESWLQSEVDKGIKKRAFDTAAFDMNVSGRGKKRKADELRAPSRMQHRDALQAHSIHRYADMGQKNSSYSSISTEDIGQYEIVQPQISHRVQGPKSGIGGPQAWGPDGLLFDNSFVAHYPDRPPSSILSVLSRPTPPEPFHLTPSRAPYPQSDTRGLQTKFNSDSIDVRNSTGNAERKLSTATHDLSRFFGISPNGVKELKRIGRPPKIREPTDLSHTPPGRMSNVMNPYNSNGKSKRKNKVDKDPNRPKRCRSSFILFSNATRPKLMEDTPDLNFSDLGTMIGEQWKNLPNYVRAEWDAKAKEDAVRYEDEMKVYRARKDISSKTSTHTHLSQNVPTDRQVAALGPPSASVASKDTYVITDD